MRLNCVTFLPFILSISIGSELIIYSMTSGEMLYFSSWCFPGALWINSVYYGTFLLYPEENFTLCHHKTRKERKLTPKGCVSASATAGLHTYFLRRSAIKFSFFLKNNTHASTSPKNNMFVFVRNAPSKGDGTRTRTGVVFLCEIMGWGHNCLATHSRPTSRIQYCPCFA